MNAVKQVGKTVGVFAAVLVGGVLAIAVLSGKLPKLIEKITPAKPVEDEYREFLEQQKRDAFHREAEQWKTWQDIQKKVRAEDKAKG